MQELVSYDVDFARMEAAANAMAAQGAPFLRFIKGDYMVGQENEEVPSGTKMIANVPGTLWGWIRWRDGRPEARQMVPICGAAPRALREELGDRDEQMWELDDDGRPRDPWMPNYELPLREMEGQKRQLVFVGGSRGISGAISDLLRIFVRDAQAHLGQMPVIELRVARYTHKKYGIVKVPYFPIVQWLGESQQEQPDDEIPF